MKKLQVVLCTLIVSALVGPVALISQATSPVVRNPWLDVFTTAGLAVVGNATVGGSLTVNSLNCTGSPCPSFNISPVFYSSSYPFSTQTFSVDLTAATPATITLAPVPLGVNGSDTFHPVYIADSVGTPEAVMITGGTAVSGAGSGTLTFTPDHNHASGNWHLTNANGGVSEALQACNTAGGGVVSVPAGNIAQNALWDHKRCSMYGQGEGITVLQIPASQFADVQAWRSTDVGFVTVARMFGNSAVSLKNLTVDMQGASQPSTPTNTGAGIMLFNEQYSIVEHVTFLHPPNVAAFQPMLMYGTTGDSTFQFNSVFNVPQTACTNFGAGGYFIQTSLSGNKMLNNYDEDACQAPYIAGTSAAAGLISGNHYRQVSTTLNALGQVISLDSAGPGWVVSNNLVEGGGTAFSAISDGPGIETAGASFSDNVSIGSGACYQFAGIGNTTFTRNTNVKGGWCSSPTITGFLIQDGVDSLTISDVMEDGGTTITPNGFFSNSTFAGSIKHISLNGVKLKNNTANGLFISATAGLTPIMDLRLTNNEIDNNPVGIDWPSVTPISAFYVAGNYGANVADVSMGISNGVVSQVQLGRGTWGPNQFQQDPIVGYGLVQYGPSSNTFGTLTLANGLNSNISTGLQGSGQTSTPTGAFSIGGLVPLYDGYVYTLFNLTTQTMTVVNEDASSTAANRIYTSTGGNVAIAPGFNSGATFKYNQNKGRWFLLSHS